MYVDFRCRRVEGGREGCIWVYMSFVVFGCECMLYVVCCVLCVCIGRREDVGDVQRGLGGQVDLVVSMAGGNTVASAIAIARRRRR
jgi:hypothetical protein